MDKSELVKAVAKKNTVSSVDTQKVLDSLLEVITEEMIAGGEVNFRGFGKFMSVKQAARTARNPKTGEAVEVSAKQVMRFKPALVQKRLVNGE